MCCGVSNDHPRQATQHCQTKPPGLACQLTVRNCASVTPPTFRTLARSCHPRLNIDRARLAIFCFALFLPSSVQHVTNTPPNQHLFPNIRLCLWAIVTSLVSRSSPSSFSIAMPYHLAALDGHHWRPSQAPTPSCWC